MTPAPPARPLRELIPHQGRMCLLDDVLRWDARHIRCRASSHRDPRNPLRSVLGLASAVAVEYAAQAAALHGALNCQPGVEGRPGFIASVRGLVLHRARLDDLQADLWVDAEQLAGEGAQALYGFRISSAGDGVDAAIGPQLAEGRLTVALDRGLPNPAR